MSEFDYVMSNVMLLQCQRDYDSWVGAGNVCKSNLFP